MDWIGGDMQPCTCLGKAWLGGTHGTSRSHPGTPSSLQGQLTDLPHPWSWPFVHLPPLAGEGRDGGMSATAVRALCTPTPTLPDKGEGMILALFTRSMPNTKR